MSSSPAAGMTQADYAARIGRTRQRIGQLVKEGKIPTLPNGRIDAEAADAALSAAGLLSSSLPLAPGAVPPPAVAGEGAGEGAGALGIGAAGGAGQGAAPGTIGEAKLRRENIATLTAELDLAARLGAVASRQEAIGLQLDLSRRLRDAMLAAAPDFVAAATSAEDERLATARVRQVIADRLAAIATELAAEAAEAAANDASPDLASA